MFQPIFYVPNLSTVFLPPFLAPGRMSSISGAIAFPGDGIGWLLLLRGQSGARSTCSSGAAGGLARTTPGLEWTMPARRSPFGSREVLKRSQETLPMALSNELPNRNSLFEPYWRREALRRRFVPHGQLSDTDRRDTGCGAPGGQWRLPRGGETAARSGEAVWGASGSAGAAPKNWL